MEPKTGPGAHCVSCPHADDPADALLWSRRLRHGPYPGGNCGRIAESGCIFHLALLSRLRTAGDYRYGSGIVLSAHRMAGGESLAETELYLDHQIGAGRCRSPALQIFCGPNRAFHRFVLDMDVAERTERSPGDQLRRRRAIAAWLAQSFCLPADGRCSELGRYLGILLAHHFPQSDT